MKTGYCDHISDFLRLYDITNDICATNRVFEVSEEGSFSGSGGISTEQFELVSWDGAELLNGDILWPGMAGVGRLRNSGLRSCSGGYFCGVAVVDISAVLRWWISPRCYGGAGG